MKQLFLLILLVLFSIMSFAQKDIAYEQEEEKDSIIFLEDINPFEKRNGIIYFKGEEEPISGRYIFYVKHKKYKVKVERSYKNGIVDGPFINYYGDYGEGKKKIEGTYKNDTLNGKWSFWWFNGQKMVERNYKDDIKHGKETEWDINGQKIFEKNYVNGKFDGKVIKWDKNGQIKYQRTYKDGKRIRK